jgi:50S ribosomal protein L16 3-hydroxylase
MANLGDTGGLYANPVIRGPVLSATFKDAGAPATEHPAQLPQALIDASVKAMEKIKFNEALAERFLGQWLTEPPSNAYFEPGDESTDLSVGMPADGMLVLDRCTRLMYRGRQLFINGEVAGMPATAALRHLADTRELPCSHALVRKLTDDELDMLTEWLHEGWLHHGVG